jgi:hypothetical protein
MNKLTPRNSIFLALLCTFLIVGIASISQASGTTTDSARIAVLEKKIKDLQRNFADQNAINHATFSGQTAINQAAADAVQRINDGLSRLQKQPIASGSTMRINYAVVGSGILDCGGAAGLAKNVVTYSSPYMQFGMCSINVLVP